MKVDAPIELVRKAFKMASFTNNMGRPWPIKLLIALEDTDIIKWYAEQREGGLISSAAITTSRWLKLQ